MAAPDRAVMRLLYTPIAGYVHTVEAVINYAGLRDRVTPVATKPYRDDTPLPAVNPIGKVPTLVLEDGRYLAGGPVIYEYLDSLHDRPPLHPTGPERFETLRRAWLADALFDTFVQLIVESWVERDLQRPAAIERQWAKVGRMIAQLDRDAVSWEEPWDIGQVRAVGALSFVTLKRPLLEAGLAAFEPGEDWRARHPMLHAWFERRSKADFLQLALSPALS